MTRINRLVLHGFKSFARRTELVFNNGFNCVLGPNGSGKSNIFDSITFVFGKTSAKAMRSEKSANLIYNGGKSKKPFKEAEVSIFFDNQDKVFPTPDKEVKLTRLVRQNGQSIYKINDDKRTREQVMELLSLAKIDPDGYNIIMQGDIVRFVEMFPEDRRLLVEDISGISVYEDKKQKAMNELNKVEEKLKEADIILTERQVHLNELKKEREQAMKYRELQDKIKSHTATLVHVQFKRREGEKKELEEKSQKAEQALKEKQEDLKQRKQEINDLRKEIERINKEIETKGEKEQVAMHKEVEQLRVSLATAQNRIQHCQEEIKKVQERRKQLEQNVGDVKEKLERIEKERVGIQESIQDANKQIQQLEKSIQDFRKKHKMEDIGDIDKQVDALDKDGEEKQKEIQTLRAKQQELLREKDKLELHIASVDDKIEKVLAVEEEHKEQVQDLKQKKQAFKEASNELNQLLNKDSELAAQLGNARQSRLTMQEDLSRLQARNISIQEQAAGDEAVKRILQQKNKIPGIFGTVAELGNVSSKYALALDVAAAQKIKSMVVKDDTTAEQCINYLKQNKLGVATFLPLNKIKPVHKHPEIEALAKEKGVHGFALDLIEYDPKFQNVFSYVFGNTLVVEDITAARNIGIGRARMATLDGDLTEISGAMHGGFRKKATMGVGFAEKELGDTIVALEKKIKDTEQLIMRLEKDRVKAEESITTLRQEKAHLEGEVIKMEKSLYLDAGDIDVSKKQKQEYQEGLKKVEKELDKMQDAIEKVNKGLAENKTKKQELRERITALRSPTIVAELQAFEEKKRELRESIIHHEAELRNLEGQKKTILGPEQENLLKVIKQTEKEEQAFAEEVKLLKQKIVQGEASLKEQEKAEKKFYEQFKDLFNQRTKMDEQIKKTEEKMEILNEQEKKLDHQLNALTLELAQAKAFVAGLEKQFEEYKEVPLVQNKSEGQLRKDIGIFEGVITRMGNINMKALEIYERVEKEYSELLKKKDKLGLEKEDVLLMMNEIETKKKELFMRTFDVVNTNFKTIFSALSTKGEAFLDLENPDNPFAGGLLVKVRLTGTKFMDIRSLSGGEKTLTALAFIFSIQEHEPASFYVLDEVDAALDKKNSEKLAHLIKKYSEKAQYIMVSHNDSVISSATNLYGVSMDEHGMSKVVSLKI